MLGEVKGQHMLHSARGALSWRSVVAPAVALASKWTLSAHMGDVLNSDSGAKEYLESGDYPELSSIFMTAGGAIKQEGEIVEQPVLAQTLQGIADYGSDYLYDTMAASLAADIQAAGGIVTEEDIRGYAVKVHEPVELEVLSHTLLSASGSSSGGAVLAGIEFCRLPTTSFLCGASVRPQVGRGNEARLCYSLEPGRPRLYRYNGPVGAAEQNLHGGVTRGD